MSIRFRENKFRAHFLDFSKKTKSQKHVFSQLAEILEIDSKKCLHKLSVEILQQNKNIGRVHLHRHFRDFFKKAIFFPSVNSLDSNTLPCYMKPRKDLS